MNRPEPQTSTDTPLDTPLRAIRGDSPEALRAFLASRDVSCVGCGYNLQGIAGPRCPECGHVMAVEEFSRSRLWRWPNVLALAVHAVLPMSMLATFATGMVVLVRDGMFGSQPGTASSLDRLVSWIGAGAFWKSTFVALLFGTPLVFVTLVSRCWKHGIGVGAHRVLVSLSLLFSVYLLRGCAFALFGR